MTLDHNSLAHSFINNVLDVVDNKQALEHFWTGQSIRLEELMSNGFVKYNVLFCHMWNAVFKTYPTKADFEACVELVVSPTTNKWFCQSITFDYNLLNKLLSLQCFALLRFGVFPNADPNRLKTVFDDCVGRLGSRSFIENTLISKWKHRFMKSIDPNPNDNMFKTFLKSYMNSDECKITLGSVLPSKVNSRITGYQPDGIKVSEKHTKCMSATEIQQYILHQDNRFLLQLATYGVVAGVNVKQIPEFVLHAMMNTFNKHVCVIQFDEEGEDYGDVEPVDGEMPNLYYRFNSSMLHIFPKICTKLIEVVSTSQQYKASALCIDKRNCLVYYVNPELTKIDGHSVEDCNMILTSSPKIADPLKSVYYLPEEGYGREAFLKTYLTSQCPFKVGGDVRNHSVLYANFLAQYMQKHKQHMNEVMQPAPTDSPKPKNVVVLIDNRYNEMSVLAALITMYNLQRTINQGGDAAWYLRIYTTQEASEKYVNAMRPFLKGRAEVCIEPKLDGKLFHLEKYNAILKSVDFWEQLSFHDKCLIIQDDGILVNAKKLDTFMEYDYVGAPWVDAPDNIVIKNEVNKEMVGNGGFSLRSVSRMIEVCEKYKQEKKELFYHNINEIPEDVYFVKCLTRLGANIAPRSRAKHFAVEQVYEEDTCGFHKFWMYHQTPAVHKLFHVLLHNT